MVSYIIYSLLSMLLIFIFYTMLKKDTSDITYINTSNGEENQTENETENEEVLDISDEGETEVEEAFEDLENTDYFYKGALKYPTWAIIFGNSTTNPATYGSDNRLNGVATDLKRIHALLKGYGGIKNSKNELLSIPSKDTFDNNKATSLEYQASINRIAQYGKEVEGTKLLFIYESGHGGQVFDSKDNDNDKLAETRCFYDKVVKDDDTRNFITKTLGSDWIVVNVVDRCHSGGLAKIFNNGSNPLAVVKSVGVVDKSLLHNLRVKKSNNTEALMKIQSAAAEGTYAMDYGATKGGLFTWKWVTGIIAKKGNISYKDANNYAKKQCGETQVPELQEALNQDHTTWSNKNIFLN